MKRSSFLNLIFIFTEQKEDEYFGMGKNCFCFRMMASLIWHFGERCESIWNIRRRIYEWRNRNKSFQPVSSLYSVDVSSLLWLRYTHTLNRTENYFMISIASRMYYAQWHFSLRSIVWEINSTKQFNHFNWILNIKWRLMCRTAFQKQRKLVAAAQFSAAEKKRSGCECENGEWPQMNSMRKMKERNR